MHVLKKIVGMVTSPGVIVLLLVGYGLVRLVLSRGKKGVAWVGLGLGCFYAFATAPLPNYLMGRLENGLVPVTSTQGLAGVKYIVVLSGGLRDNEGLPPTSQLEETSTLRVAEGVRLFHLMADDPVIIMTGQGPYHDLGTRMAALAQSLGVPPDRLVAANEAKDTYGNAMEVKPLVKNQPFLLVTSASHLPRSLKIFRKLGMKPLPAPGDFRFSKQYTLADYLPSGPNLVNMDLALHEYLGLAYVTLFPSRAGE